ncbi:GD12027 [Drosophila simulans]|uniref:GD12027 n=1 Tax=Drosophila simulans TaxID=7240 RepID=B4NRY3_DROSI|nr:GD12027 [Drosophila simulans]
MLARLVGFVRPQHQWNNSAIQVCTSYSSAVLRAGLGLNLDELVNVTTQSSNQSYCSNVQLPTTEQPFTIDFQTRRRIGGNGIYNAYQKTKMELQHLHNGQLNAFTFEYLEPYYSGKCTQYSNCLHCLTDASCAWCPLTNICHLRSVNETEVCKMETLDTFHWSYLISQPSQCSNCTNYVSCEACARSGECEWWTEDARCGRIGKTNSSVRAVEQCPRSCRERQGCQECLGERGRCVWCEASAQCFSFSVYTSEYQFGMCREWVDQVVSRQTQEIADHKPQQTPHFLQQQCKSCEQHRNCSSCLRTLSCGWCFDRDNPIEGICMQVGVRPVSRC